MYGDCLSTRMSTTLYRFQVLLSVTFYVHDHDLNNLPNLNAILRPSAYAHARHNSDPGSKYGCSGYHDDHVGAVRRPQQQHYRSALASSTVPARHGRWV